MSKNNSQTTKCWCLACDPQSGEIGLECKVHNKSVIALERLIFQLSDFLDDALKDGTQSEGYCDGLSHAIELAETGEIK